MSEEKCRYRAISLSQKTGVRVPLLTSEKPAKLASRAGVWTPDPQLE
jgi:hypothetical protein